MPAPPIRLGFRAREERRDSLGDGAAPSHSVKTAAFQVEVHQRWVAAAFELDPSSLWKTRGAVPAERRDLGGGSSRRSSGNSGTRSRLPESARDFLMTRGRRVAGPADSTTGSRSRQSGDEIISRKLGARAHLGRAFDGERPRRAALPVHACCPPFEEGSEQARSIVGGVSRSPRPRDRRVTGQFASYRLRDPQGTVESARRSRQPL